MPQTAKDAPIENHTPSEIPETFDQKVRRIVNEELQKKGLII